MQKDFLENGNREGLSKARRLRYRYLSDKQKLELDVLDVFDTLPLVKKLRKIGIVTVADLVSKTKDELRRYGDFSHATISKIVIAVEELGFTIKDNVYVDSKEKFARYIEFNRVFQDLADKTKGIIDGELKIKEVADHFGIPITVFTQKVYASHDILKRLGVSKEEVRQWIFEEYSPYEKLMSAIFNVKKNSEIENIIEIDTKNEAEFLNVLKKNLSEDEFMVLSRRFGFLDGIPLSVSDASYELGISNRELILIEERTIRKLRNHNLLRFLKDLSEFSTVQEEELETLRKENIILKRQIKFLQEGKTVAIEEDIEIENIGFSERAYNCLRRAGFKTLSDIASKKETELKQIRNLGARCLAEIKEKLSEYGILLVEEHVGEIKKTK